MFSSRFFILTPVLALASGATLGVLAPLLGMTDAAAGHVAHLLLSAGWSWAALAFFVGLACESRIVSAVLAPASLVVGVIAYYATKLRQAANLNDSARGVSADWDGILSKTVFWGGAACVLGLILGVAGNLARNHGIRGLAFRLLIPVTAFVEMSERLRLEASLQGGVVSATWSTVRVVAAVVFVFLVGQAVVRWLPRRPAKQRERSA